MGNDGTTMLNAPREIIRIFEIPQEARIGIEVFLLGIIRRGTETFPLPGGLHSPSSGGGYGR